MTADGAALRAEADRLIAEGKIAEAIEVFREAVEAAPTAENHGDFGALLYRLTAFDEAALHLRAAADRDPGNADRWIALANVYYRKTNPGEAWKAQKRAREAEPGLELGRDNEGMRVRKGAMVPPIRRSIGGAGAKFVDPVVSDVLPERNGANRPPPHQEDTVNVRTQFQALAAMLALAALPAVVHAFPDCPADHVADGYTCTGRKVRARPAATSA